MKDADIRDKAGTKAYTLGEARNKVILGDTLAVMGKLPPESVDMVFVDPPYFLQLPKKRLIRWSGTAVEGVTDGWDRFEGFEDYDRFTMGWLAQARRLMKPNATIWVIGSYHNIHRIGRLMQDMGFWLLNDVVWLKTNPVPNFLGVRFTNATETLIWAAKDRKSKGMSFDRENAKRFGVGKVGANVWVIPLCSGKERLRDQEGAKVHSTQKPQELLRRVILTSTREGDLVLDPLMGTGTTGCVAKSLGRDYIMIDKSKKYSAAAMRRLKR
jgi:DNA modification methylase